MVEGKCLVILETSQTWFEAQAECMTSGGSLLILESSEVHAAVVSGLAAADAPPYWVGARSLNWRWTGNSF